MSKMFIYLIFLKLNCYIVYENGGKYYEVVFLFYNCSFFEESKALNLLKLIVFQNKCFLEVSNLWIHFHQKVTVTGDC